MIAEAVTKAVRERELIEFRYARMMDHLGREQRSKGLEKELWQARWLANAAESSLSFWAKPGRQKTNEAARKVGEASGRLARWLLDGELELAADDPLNKYRGRAVTIRRGP